MLCYMATGEEAGCALTDGKVLRIVAFFECVVSHGVMLLCRCGILKIMHLTLDSRSAAMYRRHP